MKVNVPYSTTEELANFIASCLAHLAIGMAPLCLTANYQPRLPARLLPFWVDLWRLETVEELAESKLSRMCSCKHNQIILGVHSKWWPAIRSLCLLSTLFCIYFCAPVNHISTLVWWTYTYGQNTAMIFMPVQVGMDKAINNLTVPLGQLREEIMVCPRHSLRPHLLWDLD